MKVALRLAAIIAVCFAGRALNAQTFDTVLATNLYQPTSVSVTPLNHYLISDTAHNRIVEYNADTHVFSVIAGPDAAPFDAGAVDGQTIDARFRSPQAVLSVGDLAYVSDTGNNVIREIGSNGVVRTVAGDIQAAHAVDEIGGQPMNWGFVDGPAVTAKFSGPAGLASDGQGHLYIADSGNHAIRMLDLANNTVSTIVRSGLQSPVAVAVGPQGSLLIADTGLHSIKRWNPGDTKASLVAGGNSPTSRGFRNSATAANALFSGPSGLYYHDAKDELIVADSGNGVLRSIQGISGPAPSVTTFANTDGAGFQTPIAVTRDAYGVFLVCDQTMNTLRSVITVSVPRIKKPVLGYLVRDIDQLSGLPIARLIPVTTKQFANKVVIAVSGDETARHFFTAVSSLDGSATPALPTTDDRFAPNFIDPTQRPPDPLDSLGINNSGQSPSLVYEMKAFSAPSGISDERVPSQVTEATFIFRAGTPQLEVRNGSLFLHSETTNSPTFYYTLDGSAPVKDGPTTKVLGGSDPHIALGNQAFTLRVVAYSEGFIPSEENKWVYNPGDVPRNIISLGFENGEASSEMKAAPGQRYFAPVTLSLAPGAQAYGMQFDLSLAPETGVAAADYGLTFDSMLVEKQGETNRVIPPEAFILSGTNLVTNAVVDIHETYTYAFNSTNHVPVTSTNLILLTNRLPDLVQVITTNVTQIQGQTYQTYTTNFIPNGLRLVSDQTTTNNITEVQTDYIYRYDSGGGTTNFVRTSTLLPDSTEVITTNFVQNLGQSFAVASTNRITNSFNLVEASYSTNVHVAVDTNYDYRAVTPGVTNLIQTDRLLPDSAQVITTNFVQNLGEQFPIVSTNLITNAFNLTSASIVTNVVRDVRTNYSYRAASPTITNQITLHSVLPDSAEVIVTNFVENLGSSFPIVSTNHITNTFNMVAASVETNRQVTVATNFAYRAVSPSTTTYVELDHLLPDLTQVIVTNLIANMGQSFPVTSTNYLTNDFDLFSVEIRTNVVTDIQTNVFYDAITPPRTEYFSLTSLLPDSVPVVTTDFVTNMGVAYPIFRTNYINNQFDLASANFTTNSVTNIENSFVYRAVSPGTTNYVFWNDILPDSKPVVTTNQIPNLGTSYPTAVTNYVTNAFDLVSVDFTTNTVTRIATNALYRYIQPVTTNYMLSASILPDSMAFSATSLIENYISDAGSEKYQMEFRDVGTNRFTLIQTNATSVETNYLYAYYNPDLLTNYLTLTNLLPDTLEVVMNVTATNLNQSFTLSRTNVISNLFELLSVDYTTNVTTEIKTNALYAFRTPPTTNLITLSEALPDFAPVVSTVIVTNQGRSFPVAVTNYTANVFDLVSATSVTNVVQTVQTNVLYAFHSPGVTNEIVLDGLLPDVAPVLSTITITNLGQSFPVTVTNYVTNSFTYAGTTYDTNTTVSVVTNAVYAFEKPGVTNYITLSERLPDFAPVINTTFITNLGQAFPITSTNYLTNTFDLLAVNFTTNATTTVETNITYEFYTPGATNFLTLDERLPDSVPIVTTTFLTNEGRAFPLNVTNYVNNSFELLGTNYFTNTVATVRTNVTYALVLPGETNYLTLGVKLPDSVPVVSTKTITNLGQTFPIFVTNYLSNSFEFLGAHFDTNITTDVATNIVYEFHTPSVSQLLTLDEKLPDFVPIVTTTTITNLGRTFEISTTNYVTNLFAFMGTNYVTNSFVEIDPSFLYSFTSTTTNAAGTVVTNLVTLTNRLADILPIVSVVDFVTNLNQVFPIYATNYLTNSFQIVGTNYTTNLFQVSLTNVSSVFAGLVMTNAAENRLAVGWIERFGQTNLYNTKAQDLITYSQAHDTVFLSAQRQVVAGSFSFVLPTNAVTGSTYTVKISRPSATADGVGQDMFILAPDATDTNTLKAVKTLIVTNTVGYVVGDVSDFRWFNAGEFGDGNLLNNDMTELQQSIVYGLNLPPNDSDYLDAMDTCCYTEAGVDLSSMQFADGNVNIDQIAFGDGSRFAPLGTRPNSKLEVNDLYVAYRRSLDENLAWYERYWSNGVRQARMVPNTFRASGDTALSRQSTSLSGAAPKSATIQSTVSPSFTLSAGTVIGMPGQTVTVPIRAHVEGPYPLRTLMFNACVQIPDGVLMTTASLQFNGGALGQPTVFLNSEPGRFGAAWLNTSIAGITGDQVIGQVLFTIPSTAQANSLYEVKLDHVSASPNGISLFPSSSGTGLVAMATRTTSPWSDGIPDSWRQQYFGTLNDPRSQADVDADGDGLSNYQEYKLGTNPLDASDSLRLKVASRGNSVALRFHTASGKNYQIEGCADLGGGTWSLIQANVPGTGADVELPASGSEHYFYYRVRLQE